MEARQPWKGYEPPAVTPGEIEEAWAVVTERYEQLVWSMAIIGAAIKRQDATAAYDAARGTVDIIQTLTRDLDWFEAAELGRSQQ